MQLTMNTLDLQNGMSAVTRALPTRATNPVFEGVLIEAMERDHVTLTATDESWSIEVMIRADVTELGRMVLPGKLTADIVRSLTGEEVSISVQDGYQTKIVSGDSRFNITGREALDFPESAKMDTAIRVDIPQKDLQTMINYTVGCVATENSRPILTGCLLEIEPQLARMVALDGYRLAMKVIHKSFAPEGRDRLKCVIPGKVTRELSKLLTEEETACSVAYNEKNIRFSFSNIRCTTSVLNGEYIDYERILPNEFKTETVTGTADLVSAVNRAGLIAREGRNKIIRMRISENDMTVFARSDGGDVEVRLDVATDGDNIEIAFNERYMTELLRNVTDDKLRLSMNSNVSPCVITPVEGDSFYYLILPVRVM